MKKYVILEPEDVIKTIANSFNVCTKDVILRMTTKTVGYSDEPTFEVTVYLPMNETR